MHADYDEHDAQPRSFMVHEEDGLLQLGPNLYASFDPDRTRPPAPARVPGLLPLSGVVLLAAPPKAGKTALATALAHAVATGTPFAGRPVRPCPVLWMNYEENPAERAAALDGLKTPAPDLWFSGRLPALDTDDGRRTLDAFLTHKKPGLVVVDTLMAALQNLDLSRAKHARGILAELSYLAHLRELTVLVLHHTNAAGKRPGQNVQIEAGASATLLLRGEPHPRTPDTRLLTLEIRGRALGLDRRVRLVSSGPLDYREPDPGDLSPTPPEPLVGDPTAERLLELARERRDTAANLAVRAGLPLGTVRSACRRLRDEGRLFASLESNALVYRTPFQPKIERSDEDTRDSLCSDRDNALNGVENAKPSSASSASSGNAP